MPDLSSIPFDAVTSTTQLTDGESSAILNLDEELPSLRFSWRPVHRFYQMPPDLVAEWERRGFHVGEDKELGRWIALRLIEPRTITFCNFRRYSWSWTDESTGQTGYSLGVCYANDELPIHPLATTPELVVRDALVASWERLKTREASHGFIELFDTRPVQGLLAALYEDAVKHLSTQATPAQKRRTYTYSDPKIVGVCSGGIFTESLRTH